MNTVIKNNLKFDVSNEDELNHFIDLIDLENKYTSEVFNAIDNQYESFIKLSNIIKAMLDENQIDQDMEPVKPSSLPINDLKDINEYVIFQCQSLKKIREYKLNELAHLEGTRKDILISENLAELDKNIKCAKELMQSDRMAETHLVSFISHTHQLLTNLCINKMIDNSTIKR